MTNVTAQDIVNYVAASSQFAETCQKALKKMASENAALKKAASEAKPAAAAAALDEDLLSKTASAVHTLYGKPASVKPEQIASFWRSNPNTMLDTLHKFASAEVERIASGEHIGSTRQEPVQRKKASSDADVPAGVRFWNKYK